MIVCKRVDASTAALCSEQLQCTARMHTVELRRACAGTFTYPDADAVCCARLPHLRSRGGLRILANKAQLQASMPPSKRPRRDGVLRYLRQHVAGMIPPPPGQEPECLWAMPTNLLQVC